MTNEQAISQLHSLIKDAESHYTGDGDDEVFHDDAEALRMGISALRGKIAHWDINCDGYYPFCSRCGEATQHISPYCGNCGAKMMTRRHEDT